MSWCGWSMTIEFHEMEVQNYSFLLFGCLLVCPPPHVTNVHCHSLTVQVHIFTYSIWFQICTLDFYEQFLMKGKLPLNDRARSDIYQLPVYCAVSALQQRKQEDIWSQQISLNNGTLTRTLAWLGILLIHFHLNWNGLCWQAAEVPLVPKAFVWLWCAMSGFCTGIRFLELYCVITLLHSLSLFIVTGAGIRKLFVDFVFS